MARPLVLVSDLHLSAEYPLFLHNWRALVPRLRALDPALVIICGDLALAEPDRVTDLIFARQELDAIELPVVALPGNHDIGEGTPDRRFGEQKPVTTQRISNFRSIIGDDFWHRVIGKYRFIGINSQILGTGLDEEETQRDFLAQQLSLHSEFEPVLISHKPLYSAKHGSATPGRGIPAAESDWLRRVFKCAGGKTIFSGHMHRLKSYDEFGLRHHWVPSTAFISSHPSHIERGGQAEVGCLMCRVDGPDFQPDLVSDHRLVTSDIKNWPGSDGNALWKIVTEPSAAIATTLPSIDNDTGNRGGAQTKCAADN